MRPEAGAATRWADKDDFNSGREARATIKQAGPSAGATLIIEFDYWRPNFGAAAARMLMSSARRRGDDAAQAAMTASRSIWPTTRSKIRTGQRRFSSRGATRPARFRHSADDFPAA